jgi:hypothetical protein
VLSGELSTFPLADLFQWIDNSRRSGIIEIEVEDGPPFWVQVVDRRVVAAAPPPAPTPGLLSLARWTHPMPVEMLWPEACMDRLVDLFLSQGTGRFNFVDDTAGFDDGVPLDLGVGQVALEGMRRLDEWPLLDRAYPDESAALRADNPGRARTPGLEAVLESAKAGLSIAEARLALVLSRMAILRRIEALREMGLAHAEGSAGRTDPISSLIDKAQTLVRERQFDEAGLVFRSLLAADPADRRVRHLLREAEREQVASLYEELSPVAVPVLLGGGSGLDSPAGRRLTATDREVAGRINGRWDVASIALDCPLREVETLKTIRKLVRLGLLDLEEKR